MQSNQESFNIIITGSWNPAIFSVEWVEKKLCDSKESKVSLALPFNNPTLPPRIEFEGMIIYPQTSLLKICPVNADIQGLIDSAKIAHKILSILNHTPINGMGVNLEFTAEKENETHIQSIVHSDTAKLEASYNILGSEITRKLELTDKKILNFKVISEEKHITFSFNFHHEFESQDQFLKILSADNIREYDVQANKLIEDVYKNG
jgi:hypothetical protein